MPNPAFNRRKMGKYTDWKRFGGDLRGANEYRKISKEV